MPSDDPSLRAIEARMISIVRCVFKRAAADEEFAGQLKRILLSDKRPIFPQPQKPSKPKREVFDPIAFLTRNNADRLREELTRLPVAELADTVRKHRCMKANLVKLAGPDALIASILSYSERKLNQGGVFLRSQPRHENSGEEAVVRDDASVDESGHANDPRPKMTPDDR
jgi:hypothetical protein